MQTRVGMLSFSVLCLWGSAMGYRSKEHLAVKAEVELDLTKAYEEMNRSWAGPAKERAVSSSKCPQAVKIEEVRAGDLAVEEVSEMVAKANCEARANAFMCAFPLQDANIFKDKAPELVDNSVLNADKQFVDNYLQGSGGDADDAETLWIVEYYADWCPHCKAFAPKWIGLGVALEEAGVKTQLLSVNCEVHGDFCGERGVGGYPTMQWFYRGENTEVRAALSEFYKTYSYPGELQAQKQMIQQVARQHFISYQRAKELLMQHGYIKDLQPDIDDDGPVDGGIPNLHEEGALKALLGGLPDSYAPSEDIIADALHGPAADDQSSCPPMRPVDGWPESGWPQGELQATPKSRLADAGFMMVYTLKNWVTPKASRGKDLSAFDSKDLAAVLAWTKVLAGNFPSAHEELTQLFNGVQKAAKEGALCVSDWNSWLEKLEEQFGTAPPQGDAACTTDTCRVWTLFHILSLAPVQEFDSALSAIDTVNGIVQFIANFFRCDHCRNHALEQIGAGAYGRDDLIRETDQMPIYWWRFHNAVSVRIAAEGGCDGDRRWPSADLCPKCWTKSDETWDVLDEAKDLFAERKGGSISTAGALPNEVEVLNFLREAYWPA